jgi:hypothetical protein
MECADIGYEQFRVQTRLGGKSQEGLVIEMTMYISCRGDRDENVLGHSS